MKFSVYYHSPENGKCLSEILASFGVRKVTQFQKLSDLSWESDTDVILVEHQENNPDLDNWIVQTVSKPHSPEIFLFVEELSPSVLWKGLKLGVREFFYRSIPKEDFHDALLRARLRHAEFRGWTPDETHFSEFRPPAGGFIEEPSFISFNNYESFA